MIYSNDGGGSGIGSGRGKFDIKARLKYQKRFYPIIRRTTRIGSELTSDIRILDTENVDKIQAEILVVPKNNDNNYIQDTRFTTPKHHQYCSWNSSIILKIVSRTKPTHVNGKQCFYGQVITLQHNDIITFGSLVIVDNIDDNDDNNSNCNQRRKTAMRPRRHDFVFEIIKNVSENNNKKPFNNNNKIEDLRIRTLKKFHFGLNTKRKRLKAEFEKCLVVQHEDDDDDEGEEEEDENDDRLKQVQEQGGSITSKKILQKVSIEDNPMNYFETPIPMIEKYQILKNSNTPSSLNHCCCAVGGETKQQLQCNNTPIKHQRSTLFQSPLFSINLNIQQNVEQEKNEPIIGRLFHRINIINNSHQLKQMGFETPKLITIKVNNNEEGDFNVEINDDEHNNNNLEQNSISSIKSKENSNNFLPIKSDSQPYLEWKERKSNQNQMRSDSLILFQIRRLFQNPTPPANYDGKLALNHLFRLNKPQQVSPNDFNLRQIFRLSKTPPNYKDYGLKGLFRNNSPFVANYKYVNYIKNLWHNDCSNNDDNNSFNDEIIQNVRTIFQSKTPIADYDTYLDFIELFNNNNVDSSLSSIKSKNMEQISIPIKRSRNLKVHFDLSKPDNLVSPSSPSSSSSFILRKFSGKHLLCQQQQQKEIIEDNRYKNNSNNNNDDNHVETNLPIVSSSLKQQRVLNGNKLVMVDSSPSTIMVNSEQPEDNIEKMMIVTTVYNLRNRLRFQKSSKHRQSDSLIFNGRPVENEEIGRKSTKINIQQQEVINEKLMIINKIAKRKTVSKTKVIKTKTAIKNKNSTKIKSTKTMKTKKKFLTKQKSIDIGNNDSLFKRSSSFNKIPIKKPKKMMKKLKKQTVSSSKNNQSLIIDQTMIGKTKPKKKKLSKSKVNNNNKNKNNSNIENVTISRTNEINVTNSVNW